MGILAMKVLNIPRPIRGSSKATFILTKKGEWLKTKPRHLDPLLLYQVDYSCQILLSQTIFNSGSRFCRFRYFVGARPEPDEHKSCATDPITGFAISKDTCIERKLFSTKKEYFFLNHANLNWSNNMHYHKDCQVRTFYRKRHI